MLNLDKDGGGENWDINKKVERSELIKLIKELIERKNIPSKLDWIDMNKKNPKYYKKPEEFYQIRYNW